MSERRIIITDNEAKEGRRMNGICDCARGALPAVLGAPLAGAVVPLCELDDAVFAEKILGDGVAIEPEEGRLVAPCDGIVTGVFYTGHIVNIRSDLGCKILLHIGIDTVKLGGRFFHPVARPGDRVVKGDLLVRFDIDGLRRAGCGLAAPMIICNTGDYESVTQLASGTVAFGERLIDLR